MSEQKWKKWLEMRGDSIYVLRNEYQNVEYGGCIAEINGVAHRIRMGKVTPKKIGQFVAVWEKGVENINQPFHIDESPKFLSVFVSNGEKQGVFTFSQTVLQDYGIYTSSRRKGKMAFRVYPEWDVPQSKQALKTQQWQLHFFTLLK